MNLVGRYRPDYAARLASGDAAEAADGRLAYPSGHAAYSFMALGLTSLYLLGALRLLARPRAGAFPALLACLAPLAGATYVALSRAADHKHDFSDINAGAAVGLLSAAGAYFLNFGGLTDPRAAGAPRAREPAAAADDDDEERDGAAGRGGRL